MAEQTRLVVRVAVDGTISAETQNVTGPQCLEYISLLEDILEASTTLQRLYRRLHSFRLSRHYGGPQ